MDTPIHYLIRIAMERCDDPYNAGVLYRWLHNNKVISYNIVPFFLKETEYNGFLTRRVMMENYSLR